MVEGTLFERGTLTEPGAVQAVLRAASLFLVIDKLGHGIEQTPGGAVGGGQLRTGRCTYPDSHLQREPRPHVVD